MKRVFIFFIVGIVLFGACSEPEQSEQITFEQIIIGTWADQDEKAWIFNANGNLSARDMSFKFVVIGTRLVITMNTGYFYTCNASLSSSGRSLLLEGSGSGYLNGSYLLTKK